MSNKTYVLLKDLPDAKAGSEYVYNNTYKRYYLDGNVLGSYWDAEYVENNPDWFKLKQPVEDKRIEVSKFCKFDTKNTGEDFYYQFCASKPIPKEFSEQICRAIEYVVNDVFEKIVPPTLERQESKKDWEIISYYHEGWIYKKNSMGEFIAPFNAPVHLLILHPDNMKIIHSVRRISDGEVFELHKVYYDEMDRNLKPIKKFFVKDSVMYAQFDEGRGSNDGCLGVNSLKKQPKEQPKPLFTTEDGKDMYEGDSVALASTKYYNISFPIKAPTHPFYGVAGTDFKYFSTRKAAEEWVNTNRPCLSVNDIMQSLRDIFENTGQYHPSHGTIKTALEQLAKTKINKQ
jgi:hypothetical protein